ncbi:unnamed protein product [Effrenium voratum]|nr:unnamed protein product [Effrenium voratum]
MLQRMMKNRHRLQHFAAALAVSQLHRIVPEASVAKASTAAAAADLPRRVDQAKRLRDVYQTRFAFPEWSVELLERGELEQLSHKVTVYFPRGAHRGDVERLTKEREPVNIAMQRYYDKEKLQQFFGFTEGFYAKSSAEKLLPNIAIYCQTPMRLNKQSIYSCDGAADIEKWFKLRLRCARAARLSVFSVRTWQGNRRRTGGKNEVKDV